MIFSITYSITTFYCNFKVVFTSADSRGGIPEERLILGGFLMAGDNNYKLLYEAQNREFILTDIL